MIDQLTYKLGLRIGVLLLSLLEVGLVKLLIRLLWLLFLGTGIEHGSRRGSRDVSHIERRGASR
jgi:hypothetical protein